MLSVKNNGGSGGPSLSVQSLQIYVISPGGSVSGIPMNTPVTCNCGIVFAPNDLNRQIVHEVSQASVPVTVYP